MKEDLISIRIQNFRNISDFKFNLKPYMFLFGPNGSGKTSVIKALLFLKSNILPLRLNRTKYQLSDSINLENFQNTIINSDKRKKIRFEIRIVKEHWKSKSEESFSYFDGLDLMDEYEYKLLYKDFSVERIKKSDNTTETIDDKLEKYLDKINIMINVEFAFDSGGNDLNYFELVDNISGSNFCFSKRRNTKTSTEFNPFIADKFNFDINLSMDKKVSDLFKDFLLNPIRLGSTYESSDDTLYFSDFWESMIFHETEKEQERKRNTH